MKKTEYHSTAETKKQAVTLLTSPPCVFSHLQLNELRTDINNANRQLMAISAELSVKQAAALAQQQEISERELQVRNGPSLTHGKIPQKSLKPWF